MPPGAGCCSCQVLSLWNPVDTVVREKGQGTERAAMGAATFWQIWMGMFLEQSRGMNLRRSGEGNTLLQLEQQWRCPEAGKGFVCSLNSWRQCDQTETRDKAEAGKSWTKDGFPGRVSEGKLPKDWRREGTRSDLHYHEVARAAAWRTYRMGQAWQRDQGGGCCTCSRDSWWHSWRWELCHGPRGEPGSTGMKQEAWGSPPGEMMRDRTRGERCLDSQHLWQSRQDLILYRRWGVKEKEVLGALWFWPEQLG